MTSWSVEIRMATRAEIDELGANASEGESASVLVNGRLAAVGDEYGTATAADWLKRLDITQGMVERFLDAAVAISAPVRDPADWTPPPNPERQWRSQR